MLEVERPLLEFGRVLSPRPRRRLRVATDLPEDFAGPLAAMGIRELTRLGWMRNRRCILDLPPDGRVELDRVVLPGGEVIQEVEIEEERVAVHEALTARILQYAPSARPSRVGKFTRFLQALPSRFGSV